MNTAQLLNELELLSYPEGVYAPFIDSSSCREQRIEEIFRELERMHPYNNIEPMSEEFTQRLEQRFAIMSMPADALEIHPGVGIAAHVHHPTVLCVADHKPLSLHLEEEVYNRKKIEIPYIHMEPAVQSRAERRSKRIRSNYYSRLTNARV